MALDKRVVCPSCDKPQTLTLIGKFRQHGPRDKPCDMSGVFASTADVLRPLPPEVPPPCPSETNPNSNDAQDPAGSATTTTDSDSDTITTTDTSPTTSESSNVEETNAELPGVEAYTENLAERQLAAYRGKATEEGRPYFSAYEQPGKLNRAVTAAVPMGEVEQQIAATFKEIFYQYTNRSRRSQQKTLGPSQIGTPCDRRLVLHFLNAPHVNPGGDNWASWVGTQIHKGLEQMFKWADAEQGRFSTELRVRFPSTLVPGGTLDLLDRTLFMVADHKAMGQWSLDKLKTKGATPLYRTQLHLYGYGARQRGEHVERVALIGWPRDKSNLDDLYVWSEPYDPQVARNALERVERLKEQTDRLSNDGLHPMEISGIAAFADDCRFCPYHLPDAQDLSNGACNGRR